MLEVLETTKTSSTPTYLYYLTNILLNFLASHFGIGFGISKDYIFPIPEETNDIPHIHVCLPLSTIPVH